MDVLFTKRPADLSTATKIRSFRNTDVPSICDVWNAHHAASGVHCPMDALRLEWFALAKPYFDAHNFLLCENEVGEIDGFLHFGHVSNSDQSNLHASKLGIWAFCVRPHGNEDRVGSELLKTFMELATQQKSEQIVFRPVLPDSAFYLSIGPADAMVSVLSQEVRVCKWLAKVGFRPTVPTCMWELELLEYKPPIDRMQIQIRRTATVNQQLEEPSLPWWQACVLGHTAPTAYHLIHRTQNRLICDALFWSLSPELQSQQSQVVWLWPLKENEEPQQQDFLTFLLAESLRQYQEARIDLARTATAADEQANTHILRKLGFRPSENGMIFELTL